MIVLGLVVLSSALFLILLNVTFVHESIRVGESLPILDSCNLKPLFAGCSRTSLLTGRRRLILVLSSGCPYCRQEAALLDSLSPSYANRIAFCAIVLDPDGFGESGPFSMRNVPLFAGNAVEIRRRLRIRTVPALFLVDERERVLFTRTGAGSPAEEQRLLEAFAQGKL